MTIAKPVAKKRAVVTVAASSASLASTGPETVAKVAADAGSDPAKPRHKLVRDSYTIPKSEYAVLESLKLRAAKLGRPIKKSEALRAGVAALHAMSDEAFLAALGAVPSIKTGRPKRAQAPKAEPK
jgi:hypothetical protein